MRKTFFLLLCLAVHLMARGQTGTIDYRYWFDEERDAATTGQFTAPGLHLDISTDGLDYSPHYLHLQLRDTIGVWGAPITRLFQKVVGDPNGPFTYHIWDSEDVGRTVSGTLTGDTLHLDMTHVPEGIASLYVQTSQNGVYSSPTMRRFIKMPHVQGMDYLFCMINIDGEPFRLERVPMSGGAVSWMLDLDSLSTGIHRYTIMAITPTGAATSIKEGFFVRDNMASQLAHQRCCYQVDGGEAVIIDGSLTNGQYHFDLDMSDISNGLHKLSYWLLSDNGTTTEVRTSLFIKIPLGGTGVKAYDYWLNEDFDNRHTTTLAKQQDPFKLISLLPVETVPLRSCNFKFAFKNDTPVTYARNEFHIRFLDAGGRYVETTKEFVDEKVWEEVTTVGELQPTQTFDRVEENGIKWYTVSVNEGDTVAFKSSQACTLQLFSPSGEEVYQASGDKSVAFSGCHTWETGTYYLAVHDVTGTKPTMTLDYMHMDKYDIVSQDVYIVGNGGCSTITFKGNGFRDLYEVELKGPDGTTIKSMLIGHESDAETSVTLDFTDVTLGEYDAVFHFAEGDKTLFQMLTVEEAVDIELATNVTFPESFLRGQSVTYTVKITNKGNMTAYAVPIYTWLKSTTKEGISHIEYDGLNLPGLYDNIGTDLLSENDIAVLKASVESLGDDHHFLKFWTKDEDNPEDSIFVRTNYFFTEIAPRKTKILHLTITTEEDAFAYFTVPDNWRAMHENDVDTMKYNARSKVKRAPLADYYCCYKTYLECYLERFSKGCDIVSPILTAISIAQPELAETTGPAALDVAIAGCQASLANEKMKIFGKLFCSSDTKGMKDAMDAIRHPAFSSSFSPGTLLSCIGAVLSGFGANESIIKESLSDAGFVIGGGALYYDFNGQTSCSQMGKSVPNCPPTPPKGGESAMRNSCEPNEIYGTTSPSGSIYLTDSVKTVNYRTQFENDSVIATAAAQTVIVRDTLGTQYYDLSTFSPTFVKIADEMYELDGSPNFVKTIDMRPRIYTIVQVEGQLDEEKGIATWTFKSLDPMTMEPTTYVERGFLPVNTDGISGIGEVAFDIDLKQPLPNGTEISTRSGNVFDSNDPVMTPYWTNIIDAVAPESYITTYEMANDSTMTLHFDGTDNLSGVWKYDVYVCYGEKAAPFKVAEDVTENECDVHVYPGIVHGFFVVATDSAGNMERKSLPELIVPMGYTRGDANCDGSVNVTDVMTVVSLIMGYPVDAYCRENADTNDDGDVNITDVMEIVNIILGAPRTDAPHNARVATNEQLQISASGKRCSLRLEGDEHYTGCQLLVRLPEKCVLRSIATGGQKDAIVEYRDMGHGLYSVLFYSPDGTELPTNDLPLLDLIIDGEYARGLEVSGLQLTNRQLETVVLDGSAASPTGLFTINMDSPSSRTYDTRGVEVETPTRGVYIQQGKKVVVH
ncbi:MAG: dockerin type I repeat-containing protein [Prevotella sp.]|nr:dockerin type I repeat-containing protein [Prevotella sp.]